MRDQINTYSIGYDSEKHNETGYAQVIADQFRTNHHTEILNARHAEDIFQRILDWYDQPFGDNSALPTFHVSRFARKHSIVALSGDGGDELFGGYRWYKRFMQYRNTKAPRLPLPSFDHALWQKFASRYALMSESDDLALHLMLVGGLSPQQSMKYRRELGVAKDYDALWLFRRFDRPDMPIRKRLQYIDFHTFLPDDILTKVDRTSMAVSLEARVPFLSRQLCEFAFSLPEDFLYKEGALKGGLKYAYRDILPPEILNRGKKGFSLPMGQWELGHTVFQERMYNYYKNQPRAQQAA